MRIFNPSLGRSARILAAALGVAATAIFLSAGPAAAQSGPVSLIRDTETERMLRSYLDPILNVAGLNPGAVHLYIIGDPTINSFVAEGQNIFVNAGLIMELDRPNEVIGVLAHETGHMADGHLVRGEAGAMSASVPLVIAMALGVAAAVAGAPEATQAIIMAGQQLAMRDYLSFSRTQESSADQAAIRFLNMTHQSGQGMLDVFKKFENQELMTARAQDRFAYDHPASSDRIDALRALVDASPYRDRKDSDAAQHVYDMVRAKLRGYLQRPDIVFREYPPSDTSDAAHYARAMAYFRQPDMTSALREINALVADEPNNPYVLEVLGQIMVEMGKPAEGIEPYRKAVELAPDSPLLRISLASTMLATEDPSQVAPAAKELEIALQQEDDNAFGWYEAAEAYARLNQPGKADLATAERYYSVGAYQPAMQFAFRAQRGLPRGSTDWQRANDILAVSQAQAAQSAPH